MLFYKQGFIETQYESNWPVICFCFQHVKKKTLPVLNDDTVTDNAGVKLYMITCNYAK